MLGVLGGCGAGDGEGAGAGFDAPPNVVMIVLDTTRPGFTSAYGAQEPTTPFLESLAKAGTRFDRAYSSSSWTLPAHGSLFTGTHPKVHRANQTYLRINDELPLLAEELADAGYQTAALSGNTWVSGRSGLQGGFQFFRNLSTDIYLPHVEALAADPEGVSVPPEKHYIASEVLSWLENERDPARPFFLFVNLVEPHLPYVPYLDVAKEFLEAPEDRWRVIQEYYPQAKGLRVMRRHYSGKDPLSEAEWDLLRRMYQAELRIVDDVARTIVEAVDRVSDPANTLCFVLSDHGENFGDHGHFTHIMNLFDSNIRIVMLARGPGFKAGHHEQRLVGIHDLYPTVLQAAGITPGEHIFGVDLREGIPSDRVLTAALEYPKVSLKQFPKGRLASGKYAQYEKILDTAIGPRFKLIRILDPSNGNVEEVIYDLLADADETQPVPIDQVDPELLEGLRRAIVVERARAGERPAPDDSIWDDVDAVEDMRAMGYIGDDD